MQQSESRPPRYFLRFFRWYCHPKLLKYIEGDLMELYDERVKEFGKRKADRKFIMDVLLLFRPGIIRPATEGQNINHYGMYKNYLKIGWRNLAKNKVFSSINVAGLSLGLTCTMLIALWVNDERGIDAFHKDIDQIFVVTGCEFSGTEMNGSYNTPGLLGGELKKVIPEVEYGCNYAWNQFNTFAVGEERRKLPGNFASEDFFKIFSYPLILGTKETALKTPESIAISKKMATSLFGSPEQAMGNSVLFENYRDLKITAVFDDIPTNASEKFEYLINWNFFIERNKWLENWHNSGPFTFIKLREHADAAGVNAKIQHFIKGYDSEYSDLDRLELGLQPFKEKYLNSNFENGYVSGGRIAYVRMFQWVAFFVLLIACINFMNLSTARSLKRAKEIGVRKVNGAHRTALISQFMLEAFLFTGLAVVFSILLVQLLLPQFNLLTGKSIDIPVQDEKFWIGVGLVTGITTIISGSYPALLLSSFKPLSILKNNVKVGVSASFFRRGLVVVQFALSIIFIVGMIVITQQVDFIQHTNLGYKKDHLIYLSVTGAMGENFDVFKHEALQTPGILNVSRISQRPFLIENSTGGVEWQGKTPDDRPTFTQAAIDYDFVGTMQATMLQGRDFSHEFADSANYIINEEALKTIGYENPIGMPLTFWGVKGTIIGVVKNFHFNSLHVPIKPLVLRLYKGGWGTALIRIESGKTSEALAGLENLHKKLNPDFPFAHQFADEEYAMLYNSEQVVKKLSGYFAFLAIFISCLGLLGLVIFTGEQRTKEVGIRKVLGATVSQVVALLSKDFMKLIVLSIVIASPVAYYVMTQWLEGFEYHIGIQWWMFGLAALGAVLIAMLTISFQAIKASVANPIDSLRSE